jgi:hypothetical protein
MNVFMKSTISDQTYIDIRTPQSEPGDTVAFRAEQDAIVGVSSCAGEATVNGGSTNPIDVEVPDGTTVHTNF